MRAVWKQVKHHPMHIVLGVGLILIGIWLITNDHFFPWPPEATDLMNDNLWGGAYAVIGLSIVLWVIDGSESIKYNRILLVAAAGAMAFLTTYQFIIWLVVGVYMSWISNAIITAFVLILARGSDTTDAKQ